MSTEDHKRIHKKLKHQRPLDNNSEPDTPVSEKNVDHSVKSSIQAKPIKPIPIKAPRVPTPLPSSVIVPIPSPKLQVISSIPIRNTNDNNPKSLRSASTTTVSINLGLDDLYSSNYNRNNHPPGYATEGIYTFDTLDSLYLCPITVLPAGLTELNTNRRYEVLDYDGKRHFHAAERDNCFMRNCYSESRPFETKVYDLEGKVTLCVTRYMSTCLCFCCGDCCLSFHKTNVSTKTEYLGTVRSRLSLFRPGLIVEDKNGKTAYVILGPKYGFWLICRLCKISEFPICLPGSEMSVGKIQFGYDGLDEEKVPNPKTVSVIFPPRCDSDLKACILAAGFIIDITYFHRRGRTAHRFIRVFIIIGVFVAIVLSLTIFVFYNRP